MSASTSAAPSTEGKATVARSAAGRRPWTAAAGLGYVVLSVTGLALAPLPDLGSGPTAIQQFRGAAHASTYVVGGCAVLLSSLCLVAFTLGVTAPGRRSHRAEVSALTVAGALLASAIIATAMALVGSVVLTPAAPPATAQVLVAAGSIATWLSVVGIALALAGIAALGPAGTGLPRWAGWAAGALAVALAAAVPAAETQPAHLPALALDLWLLVVAVLLLRRAPAHR